MTTNVSLKLKFATNLTAIQHEFAPELSVHALSHVKDVRLNVDKSKIMQSETVSVIGQAARSIQF